MAKVIVGRHINGIFLNSLEYLLDDNGDPKVFESEEEAKQFLCAAGCTEEEVEYYVFRKVIGICPHCKGPLFQSDIEEYTAQCFACDEDFYTFEYSEEAADVIDKMSDDISKGAQVPKSILFGRE